jgi:hypothetical protein
MQDTTTQHKERAVSPPDNESGVFFKQSGTILDESAT